MGVSLNENLISVTERLRRAARKAGRDPAEITLIAVSKTVDAKLIKEAASYGVTSFGENYVQEAKAKIEKVKDRNIKWHYIGHLQKNKAKYAVELFDVIHTVDSLELAKELSKRAKKALDVLIQVNITREKTKSGVDLDGALKLARETSKLPNLRLRGLMTIGPMAEDPEMSRPYFVTLRRLAEHINKEHLPGVMLRDLSMGMSHDFEVAVEEGATMVRVGSAIFGARPGAARPDKAQCEPKAQKAAAAKPAVKAGKQAGKPAKAAKKPAKAAPKAVKKPKAAKAKTKKAAVKKPAKKAKKR